MTRKPNYELIRRLEAELLDGERDGFQTGTRYNRRADIELALCWAWTLALMVALALYILLG